MSHIAFTYHLVFGTYCRQHSIDESHERELYKVIFSFAKDKGVFVRRIGGMPDHVHILCDIPPKIAVADFVRSLKAETSKFMRANPHFPHWTGWADGYGGFTVDDSSRETRTNYIINQKHHHAKVNFKDEYHTLLIEGGFNPEVFDKDIF